MKKFRNPISYVLLVELFLFLLLIIYGIIISLSGNLTFDKDLSLGLTGIFLFALTFVTFIAWIIVGFVIKSKKVDLSIKPRKVSEHQDDRVEKTFISIKVAYVSLFLVFLSLIFSSVYSLLTNNASFSLTGIIMTIILVFIPITSLIIAKKVQENKHYKKGLNNIFLVLNILIIIYSISILLTFIVRTVSQFRLNKF